MQLRAPAIFLSARLHGETAVIARMLTEHNGLVAAYIAGGRGRQLRPICIPGNMVAADIRSRSESQLPFAKLELVQSRGPWLTEPLPAAAIAWVTALCASTLPERSAYPSIYSALEALLNAICGAPSARGWAGALASFEMLMLREMGYGGDAAPPAIDGLGQALDILDRLERPIATYLIAGNRADVMAARKALRERLGKMVS